MRKKEERVEKRTTRKSFLEKLLPDLTTRELGFVESKDVKVVVLKINKTKGTREFRRGEAKGEEEETRPKRKSHLFQNLLKDLHQLGLIDSIEAGPNIDLDEKVGRTERKEKSELDLAPIEERGRKGTHGSDFGPGPAVLLLNSLSFGYISSAPRIEAPKRDTSDSWGETPNREKKRGDQLWSSCLVPLFSFP